MKRYIIVGAGAVGASLAAQFEINDIPYVLVGRGAQISHIALHGLSYRRPRETGIVRLNAVDTTTPPDLSPDDILLLTMKAQDVEAATNFWAWRDVEEAGLHRNCPW